MNKMHLVGAASVAVLALPASAGAHVSLHPNAIPQGAFVTTNFRVPNEETNANTTAVRIKLPTGVLSALGAPPAGWKFAAKTKKLATPIKTDDGTVTTEVTEVDFTGGTIATGEFGNFPVALSLPDSAKAGDVLAFPTVQTYSNGQVVRWIGSADADMPAPTIDITAPGGANLDVTGGDAGPPAKLPASLTGSTAIASSGGASKGLGIAALILGALGLIAGAAAIVTTRRK